VKDVQIIILADIMLEILVS